MHPIRLVKGSARVDQKRPWELRITDIRHGQRSGIEGDHAHFDIPLDKLWTVLSQLRQMLSARQSPEMPVKNQQQPVAPVVFQPVRVPLRVMQRKWHGRFACSILHQCLLMGPTGRNQKVRQAF
jgi:hypothetical protein